MTNQQIVQQYLNLFFSAKPDYQAIRELLSDSFSFSGPLLQAGTADDYISQIQGLGNGGLSMQNSQFITAGNDVAVLYYLITPMGKVRTVEWFRMDNDKIQSIELLNDPRLFVDAFKDHKV